MAVTIEKTIEQDKTTLAVSGQLDTLAAPDFDAALDEVLPKTTNLVMDFAGLDYVASSGLRVILKAQKALKDKGSLKIINVCDTVQEVFDITGFTDILTIE